MQPPAALSLYPTLRDVEDSIAELWSGMDLRLHQFLGLGTDISVHRWRQTFVGQLLEDNQKYRFNASQVLQRDASYFRTTDFMSVTREDFDDVAHMTSKLQGQASELFSVCQALIQGSTSPQQARLEAEMCYILDSLCELEKRETLLHRRFSEISPFLHILALPEDDFELLIYPFREHANANGHPRMDELFDELHQSREQRKQMQSTMSTLIKDISEKWATEVVSTETMQSRAMRDVYELREWASQQASMEANLVRSLVMFREDAVESPRTIYAEDGSMIAVRDLLSVAQDYMELEQKVIELHKAQLDWHLSLYESLSDLRALASVLE